MDFPKFFPIRVYVGCCLMSAPAWFKVQVELLKERMREFCEVLSFVGLNKDTTARQIYEHDIKCVYTCDLMLAICDFPSTGLGYEMATMAEQRKGPVLAVAKTGAEVTRMILDMGLPHFQFQNYPDDIPLADAVLPLVRDRLKELWQKRQAAAA